MKSGRSQSSPPTGRMGPECAPGGLTIAASAPSQAPDAALAINPLLLSLGAEVTPLPQLSENSRALHLRLKPLYEAFSVFAFP